MYHNLSNSIIYFKPKSFTVFIAASTFLFVCTLSSMIHAFDFNDWSLPYHINNNKLKTLDIIIQHVKITNTLQIIIKPNSTYQNI